MPALTKYRSLIALLLSVTCFLPARAAELISVNDWGSGFIATFEHTIVSDDAPDGSVKEWQLNVDYIGNAQLVNTWMTGYNGGVSSGFSGGTYQITNQGGGFKPTINVGSSLIYNIQGQGSGFDVSEFSFDFENLDPVGNGSFVTSFVNVNDWYNPSWGGGYNVTFECTVESTNPITEFIVEFNYTGSGQPSNSWAQSYNGSIETGFIGRDGGYAVRSATGNGYKPTLNGGDSFRVVLNVNGAGYNPTDFDVNCLDAANNAPIANAGADATTAVGSVVSLNGSQSSDEDGDELSYAWSLVSQPAGSLAVLSGQDSVSPSLALDLIGEYTLELVVSDGVLTSDPDQVVITAQVSTLTAIPRAVPVSGDAPLVVTFSPDSLTDTAIEIYDWDFNGDGTRDTRETVGRNHTYTFNEGGVYLAALTVTDSNGNTATSTITINVGNEPPVVTAEASPSNGGIPLTVTFTATATDANGIQDYTWDFDGDGTGDSTTTTASAQHVYDTAGNFSPIVTVQDTLGATTVLQVPSVEVRAGLPGSPTVAVTASPATGIVPLAVNLSGTASNLAGAVITQWEWDTDGDGVYESSSAQSTLSQTYSAPGRYFTRAKITTDNGLSAEDVVEVLVTPSLSLSVSQDTIDTDLGDITSVDTVLGGSTLVSVVIEDAMAQIVRTLVPTTIRDAGSYSDSWDGKNDSGDFVAEGQYRAIMLFEYDGNTERLDLGLTSGGRQSNPSRTGIPSSFQPYANNPLVIDYTLTGPAEVTAFMGRFNANTRLLTFFQRDSQGAGTHRITWHGENSEGQLIHPPAGDRFLFGIFAYDLPDNAIYVQSRMDIAGLVAEPPIFTPTGRDTNSQISFTMSKAGSAEIVINDTRSGLPCRTLVVSGLSAGENVWEWDGLNDDGIFVSPGSYRIGVTGNDATGSKSITQYTLQRIYY